MYKHFIVICSLLVAGVGCVFSGGSDESLTETPAIESGSNDQIDWSSSNDSGDDLNVSGDGSDKFEADSADSGDASEADTDETDTGSGDAPAGDGGTIAIRYAHQEFIRSSTFAPAEVSDDTVELAPVDSCGGPLEITVKDTNYPDAGFGNADFNQGFSMMGNDFEAVFQVTGGVAPYHWELVSSAADFWGVPSSWESRQSTGDADNDTFGIEGIFDLALRMCPIGPGITVIAGDGTASSVDIERAPTNGSCPGYESMKEILIVRVTDSCASGPQTMEKVFDFDLNRTRDKVGNLYGVQLRADYDDAGSESSIEIKMYTENESTGEEEMVAHSPQLLVEPYEGSGQIQLQARLQPVDGKEGVPINKISRISISLYDCWAAFFFGGGCIISAYFDVTVDYLFIYGDHWMYVYDKDPWENWEVGDSRKGTWNFTPYGRWGRIHQYLPESTYALPREGWGRIPAD